jgi:hypothetical protein
MNVTVASPRRTTTAQHRLKPAPRHKVTAQVTARRGRGGDGSPPPRPRTFRLPEGLRQKKRNLSRRGAPWSLHELTQLRRLSDSVLARRYQRSLKEVIAMRLQRRIRMVTGPRRWTAREIGLLGSMTDAELGRRLRRPARQVAARRHSLKIPTFRPRSLNHAWQKSEIKLLGRFADSEVGRRLGLHGYRVCSKRLSLGIASWRNLLNPGPGPRDRRSHRPM